MVEITAGVRQFSVGQQTSQRAAQGGFAQHPVDLGRSGVAGGLQGDVQARHVNGRHAYGFGLNSPGKFRQQPFDATGKACGHRNHRLERRTGTAQVFVVIGIDDRLIVHRRVDGGDRHVLQAKGLVQHAQQRHAAVGGAGGVGDQPLGAIQAILVDPVDHCGVDICLTGHGLGEQHPRRTGVEKTLGIGAGVVGTGTLQHQIDVERRPVDPFRGGTAQDFHAVAIDMQTIAVDLHLTGKTPVGGVEACQVFNAGHIGQVVDRDDLETRLRPPLEQRSQDATTNSAVAVECHFVGTRLRHGVLELLSANNAKPSVGAGLPAIDRKAVATPAITFHWQKRDLRFLRLLGSRSRASPLLHRARGDEHRAPGLSLPAALQPYPGHSPG
ncbi:hypothetical protein D3C80_1123980 [compost metagenome]